MTAEFKVDDVGVQVYNSRQEMGAAAAALVCDKISALLEQQEFVNMIFAAAPSQSEFLGTLTKREDIAWKRVNAFHMDEYIGLPAEAPQGFGTFLKCRLFSKLQFNSVSYINGNAKEPAIECARYADLLQQFPTDIVCMGIGENGHIAFNDPHVANFNDPLPVKVVDLDEECRQQQVNDGCFGVLSDVPTHAITLTIPALTAGRYIYCIVPGINKADAVNRTLNGDIDEQCPASILRKHPDAILFLDGDSSSLLKHYI